MNQTRQRFHGKYRGKVTDNADPNNQGRIRASVPAVYDCRDSGWALPCAPYGGKGVGFFFIPAIGANVWIEFENGDPDYPIWVGCFWGEGESPNLPALPRVKMIKTEFATLKIDDISEGSGSITIQTASGSKIVMGAGGKIELTYGSNSIELDAKCVSVNKGALKVT